MMIKLICSITCLFFMWSFPSIAQQRNDIISCYPYSAIESSLAAIADNRELFVAIDGTFLPDLTLKKSVHEKIHNFIRPGDRINIITFSAYVNDNYTNILFAGTLDTDIEGRDDVSKTKLGKFDSCRIKQKNFVKNKIDQAIISSFKDEEIDVPKTEILMNLSQLISPVVQASKAQRKVLLIVSDMVENSVITSFYKKNQVRIINPSEELTKVTKSSLLANFNNTDIFVIGAGWLPDKKKGFRGGQVMIPLKQFWSDYFSASQGMLKGFGQPMLLSEL